jgi:hypothetical protein
MRSALRWTSLLVALLVVSSALTAGDAKKTDDKGDAKEKPKKAQKFTYDKKSELTGTLTKLEGSSQNFTVKVTGSFPDPNRVASDQNHYVQQLAAINNAKINAVERQRRLNNLQLDMQRRAANTPMKKITKDVDFTAAENVKVRIKDLPPKVDDKGNTVKYTEKEKKELKGTGDDAKLPGYLAEWDALQTKQKVTVYQAPKKKTTTAKKTDEGDTPAEERLTAVLIVIAGDAPPSKK